MKKRKWNWLRFRKNDHTHNLMVAAQRWIHANGGSAIVLGGVGVIDEGGNKYQVCIGALGTKPHKREAPNAK